VRYQQYISRGEADYQRLTDEVAAVLNEIALTTDPARALAIASQARRTLAEWPRTHFGYRQEEVRDIVSLIDASIARLQGSGSPTSFEVSLVAMAEPIELLPIEAAPTARHQLDQILLVLQLTTSSRDRVALLQSALTLLTEAGAAIDRSQADGIRKTIERQLQNEMSIDRRYARMTQELLDSARRAAENARIDDVRQVAERIKVEDKRLGRQRPEVVQALAISVQRQLERARRLRLLRDQWSVRQSIYREYQRRVGSEVVQLVKAQASLEAIRALDGPTPERLAALRTRLSGGSARLERLQIPEFLRSTHELVVAAWRFAENAVNTRYDAVSSGDLTTAWEASSAAAGSLIMLSRAQQELRALLQPPKLQ
jgi:hypothetical protein